MVYHLLWWSHWKISLHFVPLFLPSSSYFLPLPPQIKPRRMGSLENFPVNSLLIPLYISLLPSSFSPSYALFEWNFHGQTYFFNAFSDQMLLNWTRLAPPTNSSPSLDLDSSFACSNLSQIQRNPNKPRISGHFPATSNRILASFRYNPPLPASIWVLCEKWL